MKHWVTPEFVEIRMDAEINCYSSALDFTGGKSSKNTNAEADAPSEFAQEPNPVQ